VVSVPLLTDVGLDPEMVELEPAAVEPTLVGTVVSVPLLEAMVVGALPDPVGVLEMPLPVPVDPRILDKMLPRPVESEVAEAEAEAP
jgi:hypothetical protein